MVDPMLSIAAAMSVQSPFTSKAHTDRDAIVSYLLVHVVFGGDGLAQWLERWTGDPKIEGSNPVRSTKKPLSFSESKRLC